MAYASLAPFVLKRPWLHSALKPLANWYANAAGYRQMGLLADDLISEEDETVLKALKRLPPQTAYERTYRLRRAVQLSVQHKLLPKSQWTKPEQDVPYLQPLIEELKAADREAENLDSMTVIKSH
ncbi:uncharacterized protein E0L32_002398 [Thyridium curvatum]|uniref:Cytochrome b-c1 complex subunit 7 n=1 Tax=Thyridium curvatum TaxID=1093900 RepID=A0A507AEQ5_9PEZI|nr:uncharacterized protein E0L32_002398 [Thyridium curvatum]TPX06902.1 hypothetical protein E0L32_002398 [Thyridium curvatum]